jgi:TetR/AcrR family transcriptional regulator
MSRMSKPRIKRTRPRNVGRPNSESDADVRAALIDAAKQLFLKFGFEKVTAREIAAAAGTTPAMIHYYFENKIGLFRAMLQQATEPFSRMLSGATASPSATAPELSVLMDGHIRMGSANAWIASLIVNEVLPEDGKFRAAFIRDIASKLLPMLVALIEHGKREGKFRSDVDPQLTALSIVSLNMFPLISRPITSPILGFTLEGSDLDRLIAHTTKLLLQGIGVDRKDTNT